MTGDDKQIRARPSRADGRRARLAAELRSNLAKRKRKVSARETTPDTDTKKPG